MARKLIKPIAATIAAGRKNSEYSEMRFPSNLGPHSMVLNFSEYKATSTSVTNSIGTKSIALPIPSNLVDSFSLRVAGTELEATGAMARDSSEVAQAVTEGTMGFMDAITQLGKKTSESAGGALVKSALSQIAPANVTKGFEIGSGTLVNPHLALAFDGIDLKTHNFSWQLAPKSNDESDSLKKIINVIKKNILPEYTGGGRAFLKYPSVVDIFFMGSAPGHLYYFKRCMVSNFEANYAGGGLPAFVEGGKPAIVNMTIALTEMEIHTKQDYEGE